MASSLGLTRSLLGTVTVKRIPARGLASCGEAFRPRNGASCSGVHPLHLLQELMLSLCQAPGGLWEDRL